MQLMKLLHKMLEKELPSIHKTRLRNLLSACEAALISGHKLTATALGRNLKGKAKPRSNIKKVERLLESGGLASDRTFLYQTMVNCQIAENSCPWIHIDWSCLCSITEIYLLRASVSMKGRSMVLYEKCYPKQKENNDQVHKQFLHELKAVLPASVKPVIVTDAGFRAPWFKHILALDWNFVGRLRNKNAIRLEATSAWQLSQSLHEKATSTPQHLGKGILTKTREVPVHVVLYKGKSKSRHRLNQNKTRACASKSKRHAKANTQPWLLVSSLPDSALTPHQIVNIYRQRMRIEENFRDTKSTRYGLGLAESRSRSTHKMEGLLLIASLTTFACWLAGILTRQAGNAPDYQAHSARFTSALSYVYLGREVLKKGFNITKNYFSTALRLLFDMSLQTQAENPSYE